MILGDFKGGETGLNALTYNKGKKRPQHFCLASVAPAFPPTLPLSFIYYSPTPWPGCCVNTDKSKSPHKQVQPELPLGQLPGNVIAQLR